MARSAANSNPTTHDLHLTATSQKLLSAALSPSTRQTYKRSWSLLMEFCQSSQTPFIFPCSSICISNFIAHLHLQNLSPATITSHISAISYVHKICNVQDPTHHFIVRKILKGSQNLSRSVDCRMPITKPILAKLLLALPHIANDKNNLFLLRAIFLLAFHGFFRLGELATRNKDQISRVVQREDVKFIEGQGVQISLKHFKNMQNNQPVTISLSPSTSTEICPVRALNEFTQRFKHTSGPLFSFLSGAPVSHSYVVSNLKSALQFCGLDTKLYKGHSFRIGAATEAAKLGLSENHIQQLGRWHSNAVKHYIRINAFSM